MKKSCIVIGSGYAGLAVAALLQKNGFSVTILESHSLIGGCASYFRRKGFLFDVGATTFSAVTEDKPLAVLFRELGIKPDLKKIDPGMIVFLENQKITRYADKLKWIEECKRVFGVDGQEKFWTEIYKLNDLVWKFLTQNETIPPRKFTDFLRLAKFGNWNKISLLFASFRTVEDFIHSCGIQNPQFFTFVEEQLLITTQSGLRDAPLLSAALGLAYPSETYYPKGGMYFPGKLLLDEFLRMGGEFIKKERVIKIEKKDQKYCVTTLKNNQYHSDILIPNIPIWNLSEITEKKEKKYFQKLSKRFSKAPGAFVLNFVVRAIPLDSLYYQIHMGKKIKYCEASAFFVSFSDIEDTERAPSGFRTVTISTHTHPEDWENLNSTEYETKKKEIQEEIINKFCEHFPDSIVEDSIPILSGSPKTYEFYTGRHLGRVGGIAHKIYPGLLWMPANETPFENFYQIGDTAFPGQGTPAVVQGAILTARKIIHKYR